MSNTGESPESKTVVDPVARVQAKIDSATEGRRERVLDEGHRQLEEERRKFETEKRLEIERLDRFRSGLEEQAKSGLVNVQIPINPMMIKEAFDSHAKKVYDQLRQICHNEDIFSPGVFFAVSMVQQELMLAHRQRLKL